MLGVLNSEPRPHFRLLGGAFSALGAVFACTASRGFSGSGGFPGDNSPAVLSGGLLLGFSVALAGVAEGEALEPAAQRPPEPLHSAVRLGASIIATRCRRTPASRQSASLFSRHKLGDG